MENSEDITKETLSDETETSSDGIEAVGSDNIPTIKDILNKELKKDFKSDEAALKSVKDTFSYIGKKKEDIEKEVEPSNNEDYVSKSDFEEALFFSKHPEYESYKTIIGALKVSTNKSFNEVLEDDNFKAIYDKAIAHDNTEKSKSVLQTNSRLATEQVNLVDNAKKSGDELDWQKAIEQRIAT